MANRYFPSQFLYSFTHMPVAIQGTVSLSAAGAVTTSSVVGGTVTKTGTGQYTLTLADKYNALVSANVTLQAPVPVDLVPQILTTDVTGAKTIVVSLLADAVPTDPAAVCTIHFNVILRNSSVAR